MEVYHGESIKHKRRSDVTEASLILTAGVMDRPDSIGRPLRPSLPVMDLPQMPVTSALGSSPELREIYSQYENKLRFSAQECYPLCTNDLIDEGVIGAGSFGQVKRMRHRPSNHVLAVKFIRANTVNAAERKHLLIELEAIMKSVCENIVQFYGATFKEQDCWICMEIMDISLEKLYRTVMVLGKQIPEEIMGYITVSTVNALSYLKEELKIMHRDVKPSNILLNRKGYVKLCDFGISGRLIDSIVKSQDVGCRPYMAPERVQSSDPYDVRSDVWSLGITLFEAATGQFPYSVWDNLFQQLDEVVNGSPPVMEPGNYSPQFATFVNTCLIKERERRPKYKDLMKLDFYKTYATAGEHSYLSLGVVGDYVSKLLELDVKDGDNLQSETRNIDFFKFG
ncbi:unnamed protein product [Enterobius vermicularis]|uniref:mitogen-activated protein kinase kinase n=1 Tax=Enterobius vermicularis TaxID=51028 RepID=A0A0N4VAH6_ENTVE|nr:unnamed protein product [Enterobius vermicularis]